MKGSRRLPRDQLASGHETPASAEDDRAIYLIYSTQCHQLRQRSFFLFGK